VQGYRPVSGLNLILETPRLILRPPVQEDFAAWAVFSGDSEVMKYIGGASLPDAAWRSLAVMAGSWALLGYGMFSVIEKASGECIGRLGPWRPAGEEGGWPGTEIGWGLTRSAWGKGYAIEGSAAAMDFAVDVLGWTDIIHTIDPENVGSQKVAIALGSKNRGPGKLPPPFSDATVDIWGQTAEQWRARRSA
jgi:RimJ/RimL family protein N-acetyltransferase